MHASLSASKSQIEHFFFLRWPQIDSVGAGCVRLWASGPPVDGRIRILCIISFLPPRFVWRAHADSAPRLSVSLLSKSDTTRAPRPTTTFTRSLQVAVALGQLAPSAQKSATTKLLLLLVSSFFDREKFSRPGRTSFTRAGDIGPNKYGCIVPNVTLQSHCIVQSGPTDSTSMLSAPLKWAILVFFFAFASNKLQQIITEFIGQNDCVFFINKYSPMKARKLTGNRLNFKMTTYC